jgi:cytochrome c553
MIIFHPKKLFKPAFKGLLTLCLLSFCATGFSSEDKDLQLERFEKALQETPNLENGKKLYNTCIECHGPEGWGTVTGSYPQIAGQHSAVIIKQLKDICAIRRDSSIMQAFTSPDALKSTQDVADLASYVEQLSMTDNNGKGNANDLNHGEDLYNENCAQCHGDKGQGNQADVIPRLQGQHYNYLMRQFTWIRGGHRKNADKKMVKKIQRLSLREQSAIMSYVAYIKPPADDLAPEGWTNPDFPDFDRTWAPAPPGKSPLK